MNFLKLMNASEGELLEMVGEHVLKDGKNAVVVFRDKNGKVNLKDFKANPLEFIALQSEKIKILEEKLKTFDDGK